MRPGLLAFLFLTLVFPAVNSVSAQQKGYYRKPCIHGNTVIFTAEGDLWKYDLGSGLTARLTTNEGLETEPAISPDGHQVVFTGQYEGGSELYSMDIDGGVPKRLTYGFANYLRPECWTKDGKILYRTTKYSRLPMPQLVRLDPVTLATEPLPLEQASDGCYDENGVLYFTRWPKQGSETKRYKGGFIEQIWKFDGRQEATCLTADFDGTSASPMIDGNRIFFLSDRDGTMNIWSMDKNGKNVKQHTFSKGWDLHSPSMDNSRIVYQKGADIWLYDVRANSEKVLDIRLLSDFDQRKPKWIKSPVSQITGADISPGGNYVAILSRGRVFVSPARGDRWVEINRRSGIRCREVHFINESTLGILNDESGEAEVWTATADGSGPPKQLTKNTKTLITHFAVSPDARFIAYVDKNEVVRIARAADGAMVFEYAEAYSGINGLGWSPDSRYLQFGRGLENQNNQLCVVDIGTLKLVPVSTPRLNSFNAAWSADSSWFYFISERSLHTRVGGPWGVRAPEPYYTETRNIYAIPLDSAARFPFLPADSWLNDSLYNPAMKKRPGVHSMAKGRDIDWAAASAHLYEVPVGNGNLGSLSAAAGFLYWLDYGPGGDEKGTRLMSLKIKEDKRYTPVEVASGVTDYQLSANKKKLIVFYRDHGMTIGDADGQKIDMEKTKLALDNWTFVVDPMDDWKQMFADAWRMTRDYFYDRDLHGVDWVAVKRRYEPLVQRLTDRYELDDLLAQMVGEISALHTFVGGGDQRLSPDQIPTGFLGATFKKEGQGLLITHIYRSDPDFPETSSPLNKPELHIREGQRIIAVNNVPLSQVADIAVLLENKVHIPVKLTLTDAADRPFDEVVRPISANEEYGLKYGEWELTRREKTEAMSNNEIGYIHLRAMNAGDMDAFVRQFYPIFDRKGLILDVRHNFGGNIDSWVLERLMRKAWMYWQGRAGGPYWNMQEAFRGHLVILCDQVTASDGEAITEGFRRLGLGKVIGMRTWGGEIWLTGSNRLVDNGAATAAEFGVFGPEGKWLIEGHGVDPDIMVDDLPFETFAGKDAQLEAALDYLKKKIAAEPVDVPKAPPHPDKSFKYEP